MPHKTTRLFTVEQPRNSTGMCIAANHQRHHVQNVMLSSLVRNFVRARLQPLQVVDAMRFFPRWTKIKFAYWNPHLKSAWVEFLPKPAVTHETIISPSFCFGNAILSEMVRKRNRLVHLTRLHTVRMEIKQKGESLCTRLMRANLEA